MANRTTAHRTSVARASGSLVVAAFALIIGSGCKRHKPPPTDRVWLGPGHACVLEKGAGLACWGGNAQGELADGTRDARAFAARAGLAGADRPSLLTLGAGHTCGVFGGRLRCWGDVTVDAPDLSGITSVASARSRVCALGVAGLRCFGPGTAGATGMAVPERFRDAKTTFLGGGGAFFCARLDPLAVRCDGPLGAPRADLLVGAEVVGLSTGGAHACAVLRDGRVQCWGDNGAGQLGDGTTTSSAAPVPIHGLATAASVHAGARHTCARLESGTVACWGDNRHHQLANGTTDVGLHPAMVPGLHGVVELAVSGDSACARLSDGSVRCWGDNAEGQLGTGTTVEGTVPTPIRWRALSAATL